MSLAGELAQAEWAARKRRYIALVVLLSATAAASFLVLSVVNGLEDDIGGEIAQTLGGDIRIARGKSGLGDGDTIRDLRDALAALRYVDPDARFAPRLETQAIFLHGADFTTNEAPESRGAAVLVGIDPAVEAGVSDFDSLIAQGQGSESFARAWTTPDGGRLVPLIVGAAMLESQNVTIATDEFAWSSVVNMSAGYVENGRLVHERGIVVGAYETGFRMVDRLVVYAPRGDVARLMGEFPTEPPATVILAKTSRPAQLAEGAVGAGFVVAPSEEFRASYLGPVFASVRVAAWSIVGLLALMTAGWMGYTLAHHVHEDRRKIAMLRAVGISDAIIGRMYLAVGAAVATTGALVGVGVAALVALLGAVLSRFTRVIVPAPSLVEALALVLLSLVTGVLAVRWAFQRTAKVSIREALQAP